LSQGLHLHTEQHKQNKLTQTSMPHVGFAPTTPVFERAKTVHASDLAVTVIGFRWSYAVGKSKHTEGLFFRKVGYTKCDVP
jgi:hypothetical protein